MNIHEYMRFRANEEHQEFGLTVDWFVFWLEMGCRNFFGCEVDGEGNVLTDYTNPGALQRFWFMKFQQMRAVSGHD